MTSHTLHRGRSVRRVLLQTLTLMLVFSTSAHARPPEPVFEQTAQLLAPDTAAGDGFGYSVALSNGIAVAGAYKNDQAAGDAGAAYVYDGSNSWNLNATLRPSTLGTDDRFGQAVATSGDRIIVGAPRDDDLGVDTGAAYVFVRIGESWVEEAKLLPVGGIEYGRAGQAVAIDGSVAIISGGRRVFVYELGAEGWMQQQILLSPTGSYDYFGCSIAISGDSIAVGAHGFQSAYDEGRAYIFTRGAGDWALEATLSASDGESNDQFGFSVDIDGDTVLVGAWGDDDGGLTCGAAYAFERVDQAWSETTKLAPDAGDPYDYFGYFVSLDGSLAAVAADGDDDAASDAGATYLFDTEGWTQKSKLIAEDAAAGDLFGNPSVSAGAVIVGAYLSDAAETDAGSAYIFEAAEATKPGPGPGGGGPRSQAMVSLAR